MSSSISSVQADFWREICGMNQFSADDEARFRRAYQAFPRHKFVTQFIEHGCATPFLESNADHLRLAYSDRPLLLYQSANPQQICTISQPSFVFFLLQKLQLIPGDVVFEIGAGSGWNAALMGQLVGHGRVISYEIIKPVAEQAKENIAKFAIANVEVCAGDAFTEIKGRGPISKAIYTASSDDLPGVIYDELGDGALLFFVLNIAPQLDLGLMLQKKGSKFVSIEIIPCVFVPVTGDFARAAFKGDPTKEALTALCRQGNNELNKMRVTVTKVADHVPTTAYTLKNIESIFVFSGI